MSPRLLDDVNSADANSAEFNVAGALSLVPDGGPLSTTLLMEHVVQAAEGAFG